MGCCVSDEFGGHPRPKNNRPNEKEIDLSHFRMLTVMGQGGFGVVRIAVKVTGADAGCRFAVKCLSKKNILERASGPPSVLTELRALAMLDSPVICNSHYAFQNSSTLFLVLDLALGGDMRYNLKYAAKNRFSEKVAKFFISQVFLAVDACHANNILHRDIKPENLLMKDSGYIMLSDFGIAKILPDIEDCRGTSGTHGYMAPEIYLPRHKHGTPSQWFAVGVTLHEFVTGRRPFDSTKIKSCKSGLDKGMQLLTLEYLKSCSYLSPQCKNFIQSCLAVQPKQRLGSTYGLREFQTHPWLADVDWEALKTQKLSSPLIPDITHPRTDMRKEDELRILEKLLNAEPISQDQQHRFERYAFRNQFYCSDSTSKIAQLSRTTQPTQSQAESGDQFMYNSSNYKWSSITEIRSSCEQDKDLGKKSEGVLSCEQASPSSQILSHNNHPSQPPDVSMLRVVTEKKLLSPQLTGAAGSLVSSGSASLPVPIRCIGPVSSAPTDLTGPKNHFYSPNLARRMSDSDQPQQQQCGSLQDSRFDRGDVPPNMVKLPPVAHIPRPFPENMMHSLRFPMLKRPLESLTNPRPSQRKDPPYSQGQPDVKDNNCIGMQRCDGSLCKSPEPVIRRIWNRQSASSASIVTEEEYLSQRKDGPSLPESWNSSNKSGCGGILLGDDNDNDDGMKNVENDSGYGVFRHSMTSLLVNEKDYDGIDFEIDRADSPLP